MPWVIAGIFLNSILEVLGLAFILPLVTLALKPELLESQTLLRNLYAATGAADADGFILICISLVFGIFAFKALFGIWIGFRQAKYAMGIATNLSNTMYRYYSFKGFETLRNIDSGNFITNVRNIPSFFGHSVVIPTMNLISELFVLVLILVGIASYEFKLIVFLGIFVGIGFTLITTLTKKKTIKLNDERREIAPKTLKAISEALAGYVDAFIAGRERYFRDRFLSCKKREDDLQTTISYLSVIPPKISELVAISGMLMVFIYAIYISENRENLLVLLTIFAAASYRIMPSMSRILMYLLSIRSHAYTVEILEMSHELESKMDSPKKNLEFERELTIRDLTYRFENSETPILQNLNLSISKGEQLGIIGKSGSGKTSLIRILLRLLKEQQGQILVDDVALAPQNKSAWLNLVGFVQQNVFILDGSLLENVALGEERSEVDLVRVTRSIKQASLGDLLEELPHGLYGQVGENGAKLSGGQRQRIAIARALYKNAELFILDEPTSALDIETEQHIIRSLDILKKLGKTVVLVAHRFSTLRGCDRIIELARGQISAEYTFEELREMEVDLIDSSVFFGREHEVDE